MSRHTHRAPLPRWTVHAHRRDSRGLAFTPDGVRLVSVGDDEPVRVWRTDTGEPVCTFPGHKRGGEAVATHPDNRRIVTGGRDKTVRVWDWFGEREVCSFAGHTGAVTAVAFSPDGAYVASGSTDRSVRMWDLASGVEVGCWPNAVRDPVRFIAIVALDGYPWVFASAEDGGFVAGQFAAPKPSARDTHSRILALDPRRENSLVVERRSSPAEAPQASVRLLDTDGIGLTESRLGAHIGSVRCGVFTAEGMVLTGCSDRGVRRFDVGGRLNGHLRSAGAAIDRLALSCDGVLAVGDSDGRLLVYPPGIFDETPVAPPHQHGISAIGYDHLDQLFSIGRDGRLVRYDNQLAVSSTEALREVRSMHTSGGFMGGAWASFGPYTLSSAPVHGLERWELHGQPMPEAKAMGADGSAVAMSATSSLVGAIYLDRTARLFDPTTLEARAVIELGAYPEAIAVHPAGERIAIADEKGTIIVVDSTGAVLRRLEVSRPTALCWARDDLLVGIANGRLARIEPDDRVHTADGHVGKGVWAQIRRIMALGDYIVTAGRDRALILWSRSPLAAMVRLELPAEVSDLATDGQAIVYGDMAGVIGRWSPLD